MTFESLIARYGLLPHPEGGWYREIHRSHRSLGVQPGYPGERVAMTAIYFLLVKGDFSAFHRVRSEETWIHLAGAPLELILLEDAPRLLRLTPAGDEGEPFMVVPPGVLQAARSLGDFTMVTCLVAPGFDFADFTIPSPSELLAAYPRFIELIWQFTR